MKKVIAEILVCIFITTIVMPNVAFASQKTTVCSESDYCYVVNGWYSGSGSGVELQISGKNYGQSLKQYLQYAKLYVMVERANYEIESLVRYAQATPQDDVDWMLKKVDGIIAKVMAYAEKIGAEVDCEYVEYYIDGQYVMIDPLMVVNVGRKGTK